MFHSELLQCFQAGEFFDILDKTEPGRQNSLQIRRIIGVGKSALVEYL